MSIRALLALTVLPLVLFTGGAQSQPRVNQTKPDSRLVLDSEGAIVRGDRITKTLALVFTGDEFGEGAGAIAKVLKKHGVKASFFFTGRFYRNVAFQSSIRQFKSDGHYLGAHSDQHLLYCDWNRREQLLIDRELFEQDLNRNYVAMKAFGIAKSDAQFFLPPYEWYNRTVADWTEALGLRLINFTPGTRSNADYTTPGMKNYVSSETIMSSIKDYEAKDPAGLNGFILLLHAGVGPERTDKFYDRLDELIEWLKGSKYELVRVDTLLRSTTGTQRRREMPRGVTADLNSVSVTSVFARLQN